MSLVFEITVFSFLSSLFSQSYFTLFDKTELLFAQVLLVLLLLADINGQYVVGKFYHIKLANQNLNISLEGYNWSL